MNDSERELLKAWLGAAGADGPDSDHKQREHRGFFRVLREVKASAWGEGYLDGCLDAQDDTPFATENPYNQDETAIGSLPWGSVGVMRSEEFWNSKTSDDTTPTKKEKQ